MKITVGMFRPLWEDFVKDIRVSVICPCGEMLRFRSAVRFHWQEGHFDTPVYKDVEEKEAMKK